MAQVGNGNKTQRYQYCEFSFVSSQNESRTSLTHNNQTAVTNSRKNIPHPR